MEWSSEDDAIAEVMMQMWTNFARTGDPALEEFDWPEYDLANDTFVEIGPQGELTVKTGLEAAMEQTSLGCTPRQAVGSPPARPVFPLPATRHLIWIMACTPVPAPNGESDPQPGASHASHHLGILVDSGRSGVSVAAGGARGVPYPRDLSCT